MADGGFPSIQYPQLVQPHESVLDGLMSLHDAYQKWSQQKQQNDYLKANPFNGASNMGALQAALGVAGGQHTQAETGELGAQTGNINARTANIPIENEFRQQELADAARRTGFMGQEQDIRQQEFDASQDPMSVGNSLKNRELLERENNDLAENTTRNRQIDVTSEDIKQRSADSAAARKYGSDTTALDAYGKTLEQLGYNPELRNDPNMRGYLDTLRERLGIKAPQAPVNQTSPNSDLLSEFGRAPVDGQAGPKRTLMDKVAFAGDPDTGAAPHSLTLPPIPKPTRQGGDAQANYDSAHQAQLAKAAETYMAEVRYEHMHGAEVDKKTGQPVHVEDRFDPDTLKQIQDYIRAKLMPVGRAHMGQF